MKVYQINVVCGSGSTGRIAADLAYIIQECGGKSRIAYGRGVAPKELDTIKISNKLDLYLHVILTRLTDRHGLYSKGATKTLIKDIKKYNPDIIHLHNVHGYYLNYEMLFHFLKEYNKPIVWTLHDCWTFTGHCAHFDYVGCMKWKDACRECIQKARYPKSIFLDSSKQNFIKKNTVFNLPNNVTVVVVSEWLKDVTEQGLLKKHTIKKICNGINLQIMKPTENSIREDYQLHDKKIILGVASVWDEYKGLQTFYDLSQKLSDKYQVVLIGLNKRQKKKKPENVLAIDKISNPVELAKWYTVADVYVNTSVEETMGLTTVEAMACGTPVIVMNRTASPELVGYKCGKIVEPGDLQQLKDAVINLVKTKEISEYCIQHALTYEKNQQYGEYMKVYSELLQ